MSQIDKCLREVNLSCIQYPVVEKLQNLNQSCKGEPQLLAPANLVVANSFLGPGRKLINLFPLCLTLLKQVLINTDTGFVHILKTLENP